MDVGVTLVRDYLRELRRQKSEVHVPLVHRAGWVRSSPSSSWPWIPLGVTIHGELNAGVVMVHAGTAR